MRTSRAGEAAFVGRSALLVRVRACLSSGLHVWLTGESGIGKTALARRAAPTALYLAHCTPTKELLVSLLLELFERGLYVPKSGDDDEEPSDENALRKQFRKLDNRQAIAEICAALTFGAQSDGAPPVLILDDFDTATAVTVRIVRQIATEATVICCAGAAKVAQKPFLFGCSKFEIPRLSARETEDLAAKLLDDFPDAVATRDRAKLIRQIVEQSQGVPAIARELVKRAAARGDLSLQAVRREDLHGAKPLDMTPGLIVMSIILVGWRVAMRPLHDADMTVLFGFSGALFMIIRLFAFRVASRNPRR